VLVTGGDGTAGPLTSAELYDAAAGTWSATSPLAAARSDHTATLLPGGMVLVAGGSGTSGPLSNAEVYAPAAGTWLATGSMSTARSNHTATLLPAGKVLVAGGQGSSGPLDSAELYDPQAGTFSATGSLAAARADHGATLLPGGKVLLTGGGGSSGLLASSELYDPAAGTFRTTGSLATARSRHLALMLPSGKVLVAAGLGATGRLASAEVYEPTLGTFSPVGSLSAARADLSATLLPRGKVLAVGGSVATGGLASVEVYEDTGAQDVWRPVLTPPAVLQSGATLTVSGSGLRGISEGSSGNSLNSASNLPSVSLVAVEGGRRFPVSWLASTSTSLTLSVPTVLDGYYLLYATTNAIPGGAVVFVDGPPAAPVLTAPAALVNTTTPTIAGTAEAGSTVTVSLDGTPLGTVTANALGAWSLVVASPLGQGPYTATAIAVDGAGNTSPASAPRPFTVDSVAPGAPVLTAPAAFVNTATPAISGTAEAGSTVTVTVDGTVLGTVTANGAGAWNYTPVAALAQGSHTATATATDAAGNTSVPSAARNFTVDTVAPGTPVITAPVGTVATTTPVVSGTAEAGSTVRVRLDGTPVGTVTADASGAWSYTPASPLAQGAHTVTATATDAAGNTSTSSAARNFIVDTVAPAAPVLTAPAAFVNTVTPTISGTAEAGSTVTVTVDGAVVGTVTASASGAWSYTLASALAQGAHTAAATATDAVGNTSVSSAVRSFTVDTVAPIAPVLTGPAALVNSATPAITGTAEAGSTVTVTLDGTAVGTVTANASGVWSFTPASPLAQGAHTASASSTDAAGNTSASSAPRSFTVDSVAPVAPVLTAPVGAVATTTPVISGTAEAGSTVTVRVDGVMLGTVTASASGGWSYTPASPLAQGAHSATATATDAAGNTSVAATPRSFTVDTVAPTAPVLTAPAALVNSTTPAIMGTAEAGSSVAVTVDGAVVGTVTASASGAWSFTPASPLAQGAHTATATATDAAGNTSASSAPRSFTVDSVAPAAPVLTAPEGVVNTATPTIEGTAEAGSRVTVRLDGTVVGTATADASGVWSFTPASALAQGAHTAVATATDAAGNTSPSSSPRSFTVNTSTDTVPPAAPVLIAPAALVNTTTPTISGTAEAGSTVTVRLDGAVVGTVVANASGAWSFTPVSPLAQGAHTAIATATDAAGNTGPASTPRSFTVDTVAPAAPLLTAPAALVNTTTPVISGTAEAGSTVTVRLDGAVVGTAVVSASGGWSFTAPVPLTQGAHTASATVTDAAGNTSFSSNVLVFTVDTVAPASPVLTAPASIVNTPQPTISGTAEAGSTVTVLVDGTVVGTATANAFGAWSLALNIPLAQGVRTVIATATDLAGNTGPASTPRSFTVDTVAPAAPALTAPAALVNTATPVISGTAEAGSTVTVLVDGVRVGTATANASGAWSLALAEPLAQGAHTVTATTTSAAGNTSAPSAPRGFTVDSVAPAPPEVVTPADGATVRPGELSFSGRAEAGSTVTVLVDGTVVGTTTADQAGQWSVNSLYTLAEGGHTMTATATDGAGNVSSASNGRSFTMEPQSCGCASSPAGGLASMLGLLALWFWGRQRRLVSP
jgi:hypothetical protein